MRLPSQHPSARLIAEFATVGEPISKARARFSGRGSSTRAYTPEKTRQGEEAMGWAFKAAAPSHAPESGIAYGVEAEFMCGSAQRRDADNMLKLILDGLNGIAWPDDQYVTSIIGEKQYVAKADAKTVVRIYHLGPIPTPRRSCAQCGTEFGVYPNSTTRKHCSPECSRASRRAVLACIECGTQFSKPQSWADNGRALCSTECRRSHWAANVSSARSKCPSCGCPKAKTSSDLCKACSGEARKARNAELRAAGLPIIGRSA